MQSHHPQIANTAFSEQILHWFQQFGRHDLPWQNTHDPYSIWVSEIMLQQTQVKTVIPFYQRFMAQFPDINTLAKAEQDQVLHYWTGLGYYARARNLHKAAQKIVAQHNGVFPDTFAETLELPGIGRSTAGAILSFAFSQRHAILDGNVKRVLSRHFGIQGWPGERAVSQTLWEIAEEHTPHQNVDQYTQAIMDFGATLCTRSKPHCSACPLSTSCIAFQTQEISNFPGKKPKKKLTTKTSSLLILKNTQGDILLAQRPPSGIWGGLWSFPELDSDLPIAEKQTINFAGHYVQIDTIGTPFIHTFSHFHLEITPVYATLNDHTTSDLLDQKIIWFNPQKPLQIGLAAPIKELLKSTTLTDQLFNTR